MGYLELTFHISDIAESIRVAWGDYKPDQLIEAEKSSRQVGQLNNFPTEIEPVDWPFESRR